MSAATSSLGACRVLGVLSIASGTLLLCAPGAAARLYALPPSPALVRALGCRDVGVGALLLRPRSAALGCSLRAASDALDLALIARTPSRSGLARDLRLGGAASLVCLSAWLGARRRRELRPAPPAPAPAAAPVPR